MTESENDLQKVDDLNTEVDQEDKKYDLIRWRREQVLKLRAKGYSVQKIVETLKAGHPEVSISHGTVVRDLKAIKEEVNRGLSQYIDGELPFELKLTLAGIEEIIRQAWEVADHAQDQKAKLAALALAKEAYTTRQALLGDAQVLEKAVEWLKKSRQELAGKESTNEVGKEEQVVIEQAK